MNMINSNNSWKTLKRFNSFSERKKQGEITTIDIELLLGYVFNCTVKEIKDLTTIFAIQNNIGINFFAYFKIKFKKEIEYFNKYETLPLETTKQFINLFKNALITVKNNDFLKIGNKERLIEYFMEYKATDDLKKVYSEYKDCFNIEQLANKIVSDNKDISYYEGNYYICPPDKIL